MDKKLEIKTAQQVLEECGGIGGLIQSVIEHKNHVEKILAREPGPVRRGSLWVMDRDGYVHPRDKRHAYYEIMPNSYNTPERAKHFARHLSSKNWVNDQSLIDFLALASTTHKKPSGAEPSKGTKIRERGNRVLANAN